MDEIKKHDLKVFLKALVGFPQLILLLVGVWFTVFGISGIAENPAAGISIIFGTFLIGFNAYFAKKRSLFNRWQNARFRELYSACVDRRQRLDEALKKMKKSKIADLKELPKSADNLLSEIYSALRRADLLLHEVGLSESRISPPVLGNNHRLVSDQQAQELFKVADRNIAEYGQHFKAVVAGIERSEAQAVVFATTLDTLRVRMLGYRLTGKNVEADTKEFLNVVTEAKMQFQAIDKALEEIELTPFPEVVTIRQNIQNSEPNTPPNVESKHLKPHQKSESDDFNINS